MVQAHDRLQRAAAEMNTLRLSTTRSFLDNSEVDILSQQLSQIPADLSSGKSPVVISPIVHRSKRSRTGYALGARTATKEPLSPSKNHINVSPVPIESGKRGVEILSSVTQDEEEQIEESPVKKPGATGSEYGDLIADETGFSQFDI